MKATTNPKASPPKPHALRDNETFLRLYTGILSSFYSRFAYETAASEGGVDGISEDELHGRCRSLAQLAYLATCHAHAQLQFAERYSDEEIEQFNAAISNDGQPNSNGD